MNGLGLHKNDMLKLISFILLSVCVCVCVCAGVVGVVKPKH